MIAKESEISQNVSMSTQNNRKKPKSKAAREKLGNRPFSTVAEYNVFKEDIQKSVIKQLEFARAMEEYTALPEYEFFKKKIRAGYALCVWREW